MEPGPHQYFQLPCICFQTVHDVFQQSMDIICTNPHRLYASSRSHCFHSALRLAEYVEYSSKPIKRTPPIIAYRGPMGSLLSRTGSQKHGKRNESTSTPRAPPHPTVMTCPVHICQKTHENVILTHPNQVLLPMIWHGVTLLGHMAARL